MGLHDAAIAIARVRGYLSLPEVALVRAGAPAWFLRLCAPEGIAQYERRAGIRLPRAVVDFYAALDFACFVVARHFDVEYFNPHATAADRELKPAVESLFGRKYVIFDEHRHSASRGCIPLDAGDDPPVFGSVCDDPLFYIAPSFTEYIRRSIEDYDRCLREWKQQYKARPERYPWVVKLPGFDGLA